MLHIHSKLKELDGDGRTGRGAFDASVLSKRKQEEKECML